MKRFVNFKREVDGETRNKPCWIVFIAIDGACGYRKEVKALRYDALPVWAPALSSPCWGGRKCACLHILRVVSGRS